MSIHEINKICKRLEVEKIELEATLYQAEATLEQEENKAPRCQLELNQVQQEIVHRISEKEEEFVLIKKNYSMAVENMQSALETEAKAKVEDLHMKKKLVGNIGDQEITLDYAHAEAFETQRSLRKYKNQIRDAQMKLEEEYSLKSVAQQPNVVAGRKSNAAKNTLEEARNLLEQADKSRRQVEQDLSDTNQQLADFDKMANKTRLSEEKAARDISRLAEELHTEQDLSAHLERNTKVADDQVKYLSARVDKAYTTGEEADEEHDFSTPPVTKLKASCKVCKTMLKTVNYECERRNQKKPGRKKRPGEVHQAY